MLFQKVLICSTSDFFRNSAQHYCIIIRLLDVTHSACIAVVTYINLHYYTLQVLNLHNSSAAVLELAVA